MKASYDEVVKQLDKLFFLPLSEGETPELRAEAIDAYLNSVEWTWDDVLDQIGKPNGN